MVQHLKTDIQDNDGSPRYHVSTLLVQGMYETCIFREFGFKGSQVVNRVENWAVAEIFHSGVVAGLRFAEGIDGY